MRLVVDQVLNIRLWPSPREDIGATRKPIAEASPDFEGDADLLQEVQSTTDQLARIAPVAISHRSSALEKVLEYRFLAELGAELWHRGMEFEVLRDDVDAHGHDLVIETAGILRYIQLKAMMKGGKRADVTVNTRLATKSSGCVIWMTYDPATLELGPFRWFGGKPGEPLQGLGDKVARHSKGNAAGEKSERPAHRVIPRGTFEMLESVAVLADRLFGKQQ